MLASLLSRFSYKGLEASKTYFISSPRNFTEMPQDTQVANLTLASSPVLLNPRDPRDIPRLPQPQVSNTAQEYTPTDFWTKRDAIAARHPLVVSCEDNLGHLQGCRM